MSAEFWDDAIIAIYFFYGLAFYSMGLALLVESGRASGLGFARSMRLLAGFGLLHGSHEWIDMFERGLANYYEIALPDWVLYARLAMLVASFIALMAFGEHLLVRERYNRETKWVVTIGAAAFYLFSNIAVKLVYNLGETEWRLASDILARYLIGIPGAVLACWALWEQRHIFRVRGMSRFVNDVTLAAVALAMYGLVGQVFTPKGAIFPSQYIHDELFREIFDFPVQLLRAGMAAVVAIAMIRVLRSLEVDNQQHLDAIRQANQQAERRNREELARLNKELVAANEEASHLLQEVRRRDALRGELLQRITAAQEAERKRIARELHDGTGQMLTGLGLGLRGLSNTVEKNPTMAATRLSSLEEMAVNAIGELRNLINDLRPPQLDDMGLAAALRFMANTFNERESKLTVEFETYGDPPALSPEVETSLFRIAQEGLTNVIKHANASHVCVTLRCHQNRVCLIVCDDGVGFNSDTVLNSTSPRGAWGLMGMQERANLISADLNITAEPGKGTLLTVCVETARDEEQRNVNQSADYRRPCGCPRRDANAAGERSELDCCRRRREWAGSTDDGAGAFPGRSCDGCDYAPDGWGRSDPAH